LPGAERLAVSEHLEDCRHCAEEFESLGDIGRALRQGVNLKNVDATLAGLASGVTSLIKAEESQSWRATWERMFEDWHWVAVGVGSVAGALLSFVFASAMLVSSISRIEQFGARAGTLYLIALPQGDRGPAMMLEFVPSLGAATTDARSAVPASIGWQAERALVTALDEKLVSSGQPTSLHGLSRADREEILGILKDLSDFRYVEPTRRPGGLTNVSGMHLYVNTSVTAEGN
jgi:anti-sigma factor RsiW